MQTLEREQKLGVVQREEEQVKRLFDRVDEVEEIALSLEETTPEAASKLHRVAREALSDLAPVRLRVAASVLHITERTARTWASEGLLRRCSDEGQSPVRVDAIRLHRVWQLVRELRAQGKRRDLLNAVWYRLADEALLDHEDVVVGLEQLRAGEARPALTLEEEMAQKVADVG